MSLHQCKSKSLKELYVVVCYRVSYPGLITIN